MILDEAKSLLETLEKTGIFTSNLDSQIIIEYEEEKTKATITITRPIYSGRIPSFDEIMEVIEEEGIINPDCSVIKSILDGNEFEKKFVIANGRKAEKGEDAKYLYRFGKGIQDDFPIYNEEVIPGQLIAVKLPPKMGEDGITVDGKVIPGIMGDDIGMVAGKNTVISKDRTKIYAVRNGHVIWKENRVDIEPILKIDGDLTKDIEFDGMIEIGTSCKNIEIKTSGGLIVYGNIENCDVMSGGSIEVFNEIIDSKIVSKQDIIADSATSSNLSAGSSIIIKTGLLNCESSARNIFVCGKKGIIMSKGTPPPALFTIPIVIQKGISGLTGGKVYAQRVIDADVIGSVEHKPTEVRTENDGKISVSSTIYPKTKLIIGGRICEIMKPEEGITFIEEKRKIIRLPYEQQEAELAQPIYGPVILKDPPSVMIPSRDLQETMKFASSILGIDEGNVDYFDIHEYSAFIFFPKKEEGPWISLIDNINKKRREYEERNGTFRIESLPEGVFLTVFPPGIKGAPVSPKDVVEHLKEFSGLDVYAIKDALIKKEEKPVKIGPRQYIPEIDGRIILSIQDEGEIKNAKAYLTITQPRPDGKQIPFTDILKFLEKERIKDPDKRKIIAALRKNYYNKPFLIASYKPPTKGKNANYIYKFEESKYSDVEVIPGQIIAIKDKPSLGESGIDVFGEIIPGILGDDFFIQPGINTYLSPDRNILYSSSLGKVFWTDNRVDVEKVLEYNQDLKENLVYDGKIVINGSVANGIRIKAGGGITIKGSLGTHTELISGGSIEVYSDISNANLDARGDIIANSIDSSRIKAGGSVILRTGMINCESTSSSIIITGRRGIIMTKGAPPPPLFSLPIVMAKGTRGIVGGGRVEVENIIDVEQIGSIIHTKTEIFVKNNNGKIAVSEAIYPKVRVTIGKAFLEIRATQEEGVTFKLDGGRIARVTYEPQEAELIYTPYETEKVDFPPSIALMNSEGDKASVFLDLPQTSISFLRLKDDVSLFFLKDIVGPWKKKEEEIEEEMEKQERRPGSFKIDNTPDGLYLTVYPPGQKGKAVSVDEIVPNLSEFVEWDEDVVKSAIEKKDGKPIKIGLRQYIEGLDPPIKIEVIDEDGIKAKRVLLTIGEPKPGGKEPRLKDVLFTLKKQGLTLTLIDEKKIIAAIKKKYYKPFTVSLAHLPTKGEKAQYLYKFGRRDEKNIPSFNLLDAIPGQVLAIKRPPARGNSGMNCLGEEIPGILGDDFEIVEGRNTILSEDGCILYSCGYGWAVWDKDRCDVEKTLCIDGDLNEDIEFPGRLIISGSIKEGVNIKAGGNIEVGGDVGDECNLQSKETVKVGGHIGKALVSSECNIIASSADSALLSCNGTIIMETGARCNASCKRIYAIGKKGVIMSKKKPEKEGFTLPVKIERGVKGLFGGKIEADELVFSDIVGSISFEETNIVLKEGGKLVSQYIYPKTRINISQTILDITKELENISFYKEGGKIAQGIHKDCEIILEKPEKTKGIKYEESIILPLEQKGDASIFLNIPEDALGSFEIEKDIFLFFEKNKKGPWIEFIERIEEEKRREEEVPASFEIKNLLEGLFLIAKPGGARGLSIDLADVEKALSVYYNVNFDIVKKAISSPDGIPVKIGQRQYIEGIDSKIEVIVDSL